MQRKTTWPPAADARFGARAGSLKTISVLGNGRQCQGGRSGVLSQARFSTLAGPAGTIISAAEDSRGTSSGEAGLTSFALGAFVLRTNWVALVVPARPERGKDGAPTPAFGLRKAKAWVGHGPRGLSWGSCSARMSPGLRNQGTPSLGRNSATGLVNAIQVNLKTCGLQFSCQRHPPSTICVKRFVNYPAKIRWDLYLTSL